MKKGGKEGGYESGKIKQKSRMSNNFLITYFALLNFTHSMIQEHHQLKQGHCAHCSQKSDLIQKYEKLIKLLKKKQQKTNSQLSLKLSNGRTTSHTSEATSTTYHSCKLFYALNQIFHKRCYSTFCALQKKSAQKFLLMSIFNRTAKTLQRIGFKSIQNHKCKPKLHILQQLDHRFNSQKRVAFSLIKLANKLNKKVPVFFDDDSCSKDLSSHIKSQLFGLKESIRLNSLDDQMPLDRKIMQLSIKNYKLEKEMEDLREMLQQANRRLKKQNEKKRESLQMLAEELNQKNELIGELQGTIKMYENKYQICNNVLDEDVVGLKNEVQNLENLKNRLESELGKLNKKVQILNGKEKNLEEEASKLEKENYKLREKLFDVETLSSTTNNLNSSLSKLIQSLNLKAKRLNIIQNKINHSKRHSEEPIFEEKVDEVMNQSKLQIVLCFLQNIHIHDYQLPSLELFDEEEQQVLVNHQIAYHRFQNDIGNKSHTNKKRLESGNDDEIEYKGRNVSGTMFGWMDSPRQAGDKGKNLSIKLLEMEIEKNKQIEKISELKQKLMHIRVIILNLLKSLQKNGLRSESEGIIQILFDIFEYSEEEREEVFPPKRKKFFGLI